MNKIFNSPNKRTTCPFCFGLGKKQIESYFACLDCKINRNPSCRKCRGSGMIVKISQGGMCKTCRGSGFIYKLN